MSEEPGLKKAHEILREELEAVILRWENARSAGVAPSIKDIHGLQFILGFLVRMKMPAQVAHAFAADFPHMPKVVVHAGPAEFMSEGVLANLAARKDEEKPWAKPPTPADEA